MATPAHILELRKHVGNAMLVLPCAAVLPQDNRGRILLVHDLDRQVWEMIGGYIEPGESPQECAVREAREEAGIDVTLGKLVGAYGGGNKYRVIYPNGDQVAIVLIVFQAFTDGSQPHPDNEETDDVRWFARDDLIALHARPDMHPLDFHVLYDLVISNPCFPADDCWSEE
jgi:8-oxo-dGTP diphosphatase